MSEQSSQSLFARSFRKKRGDRPPLNGHALALAQRFSTPAFRPAIFAQILRMADGGGVALIAIILATILGQRGDLWVQHVSFGAGGGLIYLAIIQYLEGYRYRAIRSIRSAVLPPVIAAVILGGATYALAQRIPALMHLEVGWLILLGVASLALSLGMRVWVRALVLILTKTGKLEHRIVVVGGGEQIEPLIRAIGRDTSRGRRLVGFFDDRRDLRSPAVVEGYHKLGNIDDLVEFGRLAKIDTVIIALPLASEARLMELMTRLWVLPVDIRLLATSARPEFADRNRSEIGGLPMIDLYKRPIYGMNAFVKRCFDLVFASLAVIAFAPLMLVIAVLIKLESRGPVLFRQKRHGFNNKPIEVLKFRSMYVDQCDATAVKAVRRGDARVTRVGRFIRRTSIDELPQFFNVLKGELSLVGPRPHAMAARTGDIQYTAVSNAYTARHKVKPGVTGWAQVKGWRGELNSDEKIRARIEHDLYYIENWSVWLDLKILLMTPIALVTTKNAY